MLMALNIFGFFQLNVNVFGHLYLMLNNPILYSIKWMQRKKKSHFVRLTEKCPRMHLNGMKTINYRTNDVYIMQKVSTVLSPSWWWRQLNTRKYRLWNSGGKTYVVAWSLISNSCHASFISVCINKKRPVALIQFIITSKH